MLITRKIGSPKKIYSSWDERWNGEDYGLIATWERGIEMRKDGNPAVISFQNGELPVLPWRGGVEKKIEGKKFGSLKYLAMRQGILNIDLNIDTEAEVTLTCSKTGVEVKYSINALVE